MVSRSLSFFTYVLSGNQHLELALYSPRQLRRLLVVIASNGNKDPYTWQVVYFPVVFKWWIKSSKFFKENALFTKHQFYTTNVTTYFWRLGKKSHYWLNPCQLQFFSPFAPCTIYWSRLANSSLPDIVYCISLLKFRCVS